MNKNRSLCRFGLGALFALPMLLTPALELAQAQTRVEESPPCAGPLPGHDVLNQPVLRVLSVNLAHGRRTGLNQMLQSGETARRNIAEAAKTLSTIDADIIALQEADAPSAWSGSFNHVEAVADAAGYPCRHHGVHANTRVYSFGTALLSRFPFTRTGTYDFAPTPPTTQKGFVAAQIAWNPNGTRKEPVTLTLVSVHLDFSRKSSREAQFEEMFRVLREYPRPLVLMGDFNTEWADQDGLLKRFVDDLDLRAWAPGEKGYGTYDKGRKRLDWILVSDDLMFSNYRVVEEVVSDHQPVLGSIHFARPPGKAPQLTTE